MLSYRRETALQDAL